MPKILINEVDLTSPGTPGRYGNYTVLIAGFTGRDPKLIADVGLEAADKVQPDENGVYEFNSVQAFEDTIGVINDVEFVVIPTSNKDQNGNVVKKVVRDSRERNKYIANPSGKGTNYWLEYHYGNRVAVELLNLGYPIIYKPINSVREMEREDFWDIFKDKASYDFRFVTHGLLETNYAGAEALIILHEHLDRINEGIFKLEELEAKAQIAFDPDPAGDDYFEYLEECQKLFAELIAPDATTGKESPYKKLFKDLNGNAYANYVCAKGLAYDYDEDAGDNKFTELVGVTVENGLYNDKVKTVSNIDETNEKDFTVDCLNKINGNIARLASYRALDDGTGVVLADGRGDCVALIELDEDVYCKNLIYSHERPEIQIIRGIRGMSSSIGEEGAYCALTVPSVYYAVGNGTKKFPAAFHYLACFMRSISLGYPEWFAAAGYTRGVSSYVIDHTSVKLGEIAIGALEPRNLVDDPQKLQPPFACNVIANFRGSYYLWGNRTAAALQAAAGGGDLTADDFLNIRQLCSTLKKQVYVSCRRFTFDPNSDTLWINFVNSITPTLDAMKAGEGIRDYKIVKIYTDKKATLKARIRIIPIEAVEDFDITIALEDSFGNVAVTAVG